MIFSTLLATMLVFSSGTNYDNVNNVGENVVSFELSVTGQELDSVDNVYIQYDNVQFPLLSITQELVDVKDSYGQTIGQNINYYMSTYTGYNVLANGYCQLLDPRESSQQSFSFSTLVGQYNTQGARTYTFTFEYEEYPSVNDIQDYWCTFYFTLSLSTDGDYVIYSEGYEDGYNVGHREGYNEGYKEGHSIGLDEGYQNGYSTGVTDGHTEGYDDGYAVGRQVGYQEGISTGTHDYGFLNLFGAIADTPIMMMRRMFSFDLFGTSMLTIILTMFTALLVLKIVKKVIK